MRVASSWKVTNAMKDVLQPAFSLHALWLQVSGSSGEVSPNPRPRIRKTPNFVVLRYLFLDVSARKKRFSRVGMGGKADEMDFTTRVQVWTFLQFWNFKYPNSRYY